MFENLKDKVYQALVKLFVNRVTPQLTAIIAGWVTGALTYLQVDQAQTMSASQAAVVLVGAFIAGLLNVVPLLINKKATVSQKELDVAKVPVEIEDVKAKVVDVKEKNK